MKHLARIQIEFLKYATWEDLSFEQQQNYLNKHPKSKKHLITNSKMVIEPITKEIEDQIKDNSLYHVTSKENAENILKHNYFRPSSGTIGIKGLSTTFDPNYNWGNAEVKFVLDYEKLKKDYPLFHINENLGIDEKEIKVTIDEPILDASKYIKHIICLK